MIRLVFLNTGSQGNREMGPGFSKQGRTCCVTPGMLFERSRRTTGGMVVIPGRGAKPELIS